ncbi:MAG: T9SS type A sorting domain-containing protein [Candidatus Cloacimonetes bacterium]|nr:T9SS type A sorting domain-containing protein [Candidatus Cloacimonadota bacterium]
MKNKLLLLLLLLMPFCLVAETLLLHLANGETIAYDTGSIIEITFDVTSVDDWEHIPGIEIINSLSNYPNPFNPETTISFELTKQGHARVSIYNLKGQRVANVLDRNLASGTHTVLWQGRNQAGNPVASGVYLLSVTCDGEQVVRKIMMIK